MSKRERAGIIFAKQRGRLMPVAAVDAEEFDALPEGTEVDILPRTKRSNKQLRTFWKAVGEVVKATDAWASKEHLCDALKRDLGYMEVRRGLDGRPYITTESIALEEMEPPDFQRFMDAAMQRLAEVTGIDALAFLETKRAA